MKVSKRDTISCAELNKIDLVDYLSSLGYTPAKIKGSNFWYLSPLPDRNEKTPSFKVNRNKNAWYDFGIGEGGSLIDFCVLHDQCTIRELIEKFSNPLLPHRNPPQNWTPTNEKETPALVIDSIRALRSYPLIRYLQERRIDPDIAYIYCKEASYSIDGKNYYAIAFANCVSGFELRNKYFKGSSSPKGITFLDNGAKKLCVFEGFFDFLTYCTIINDKRVGLTNFLILN